MTDHTPLTEQQLAHFTALATSEHLTPGPWRLDRESCDCGDGYGCSHGMYVTGVVTPVPTEIAADRCKRTGEQPRDYDFHRSDIGDFPEADWELMVAARDAMPVLLAEVRRLRDEVAPFTDSERTMLRYALDQGQERIWSEGGFTDEDQAAMDSLRARLNASSASVAPVPAPEATGPHTTPETAGDGQAAVTAGAGEATR